MIIDDFRTVANGSRSKVLAKIHWEECNRPDYELYFETESQNADGFFCNPDAFLVGCAVPAFHFGEKRLLIRDEVCPELVEGINNALHILKHWYYDRQKKLIVIEAKKIQFSRFDAQNRRAAGSFLSGGIDSLATLAANRLAFSPRHERAIKAGFLVFGLEQDDPVLFEHVRSSLEDFACQAAISLVPVYTNIYMEFRKEDAELNYDFWRKEFGGAALAAVAHVFSGRLSSMFIGATYTLNNLEPWGSHPILDPNFGSSEMRIIHDGLSYTRQQKLKLVADWDLALRHIRVCNHYKNYREGKLNCGECEKCVRTMLGLLALGKLDKTSVFPKKDVSAELVLKRADILKDYKYLKPVYEEMIPGLLQKNRIDLVKAIRHNINKEHVYGFKKMLMQADKKLFKSNIKNLKRLLNGQKV